MDGLLKVNGPGPNWTVKKRYPERPSSFRPKTIPFTRSDRPLYSHFGHDRPVWSIASDIIENAQKIVVVGDGMAGKTALLTRFVHPDTFTREYSPTIFENQSHFIEVNNQQVRSHENTILNLSWFIIMTFFHDFDRPDSLLSDRSLLSLRTDRAV